MRTISRMMLWLSLVFLWIGYVPKSAMADDFKVPALTGRVNDEAGMLSPEAKERLERELADYEQSTEGVQIAVLTTNDFQGLEVEDYSIKVASAWALGQKGVDNGVLITFNPVAREIRIEVGRGLEGILTDLQAGHIIDEVAVPNMKRSLDASDAEKQSFVDAAVAQTAEEVMKTIGTKPYPELVRLYEAEQARQAAESRALLRSFGIGGIFLLACGVVFYFVNARIERKRARATRLGLIQGLESQLADTIAHFESARESGSKYVTEARLRQYESDRIDAESGVGKMTEELRRLLEKDADDYEWEKAYWAANSVLDAVVSAIADLSGAYETVAGIGNDVEEARKLLRSAREAVSKPKVEETRRDELDAEARRLERVVAMIPRTADAKAFDYILAASTLAAICAAFETIRENAISDITPKKPSDHHRSDNRHSYSSPSPSIPSSGMSSGGFSGGGGGFSGGGASGRY